MVSQQNRLFDGLYGMKINKVMEKICGKCSKKLGLKSIFKNTHFEKVSLVVFLYHMLTNIPNEILIYQSHHKNNRKSPSYVNFYSGLCPTWMSLSQISGLAWSSDTLFYTLTSTIHIRLNIRNHRDQSVHGDSKITLLKI